MKLFCPICRKELLKIPTFKPNKELDKFLILIECCEEFRVFNINITH